MPATPFTYTNHPTHPELRPWIRGSWEFATAVGAPIHHHVPPDGLAFLVLVDQAPAGPIVLGYGPQVEPLVVPTAPGVVYRGLRLAPEAAPLLLGTSAAAILHTPHRVTQVGPVPVSEIITALGAGNSKATASAISALFLPQLALLPELDTLVTRALGEISSTDGRLPLPDVASHLGVSSRTMLRRVKAATGLTPKQHARIARFLATAYGMLEPGTPLSHLAARGGYADQPHFHHEVTALTGLTPAQLAERVRGTDHRSAE